ncbi:MAG: DinB family protein [Lewinella sp.]|nr:DinB family protein [Lewinella sp.]
MSTDTLPLTLDQLDTTLAVMAHTRRNMEAVLRRFSQEQLNKIPKGFKNNLAWNFGHVIVTEQLLTYGRVGLPAPIAPGMITKFRRGTVPKETYRLQIIEEWYELAQKALIQTRLDYEEGKFTDFKPYVTTYGLKLNNIEESFTYLLSHEALHLGTMMAMARLV